MQNSVFFIINKKIIYFLVSVLSFRFLLFCFVIWSFFWYFFLCFVSSRKIGSFRAFTLCPTSRLMAEKHRCWILKIQRLWSFIAGKRKIIEVKSFSRTNLRLGSNEMSKSLLGDDCINIERVAERKCSQRTTYLNLFLPQLKKFKLKFKCKEVF